MKLKTTLPYLIGSAYGYVQRDSPRTPYVDISDYGDDDLVEFDSASGAPESNAINAWVMQNFKAFLDCTNAIDMGVDDEKNSRNESSREMINWHVFNDPIYLNYKYDHSVFDTPNRIPAWPTIHEDFQNAKIATIETFAYYVTDHATIMASWKPDDIKVFKQLQRGWFKAGLETEWHWFSSGLNQFKYYKECHYPALYMALYFPLPNTKPANPLLSDDNIDNDKLCALKSDRKKCGLFKACYFSETYKGATGEQWEDACPGIKEKLLGDKSGAAIQKFLFKNEFSNPSDKPNKSDVCKGFRFVPQKNKQDSYPKVCKKRDCVDIKPSDYYATPDVPAQTEEVWANHPSDPTIKITKTDPVGGVSYDNTNQPALDPFQFYMRHYKSKDETRLADGSWLMLNMHASTDCHDRTTYMVWEEYKAMTMPMTEWDFSGTYQPYADDTDYQGFMDSDIPEENMNNLMDRGLWDWIGIEEFYNNFSEYTKNMYASFDQEMVDFFVAKNDRYVDESADAQKFIFMYNRFMFYRYCHARPLWDAMQSHMSN